MSDQTVATLQLVKRKDADSSDINTLDLLSLPTELQYQGWQQALPQSGASSVDEVVTLLMNAGNADTLATALQAIDTKIKETQWAQDPLNPIGVWLRSKLQGETNARQSFVLNMNRPQAGLGITNPLAYNNIIPDYGLGITRMPVWENVLAQSITSSAITIHGGKVSYTVNGDAHARVAQAKVSSSDFFTETWMGVKSNRYGVNPANFVPTWHMHLGHSDLGSDTTTASDSEALDGTKLVCDFAGTTTMAQRVSVRVDDVTANVSDQRGKYTVLMRAHVTGTLIANVRVGHGYYVSSIGGGPFSFTFQPRVQISNTFDWIYYTLGQVKIPATSGFFNLAFNSAAIGIQAEVVSGSGNLHMDSLVLIPAEHSVHINNGAYGNSTVDLYILGRPDKRLSSVCYNNSATSITIVPEIDSIDWSLPSGSGVIVCAGSSPLFAHKSATFTPGFTVYPAYNSLRGSA